AYVSAGYRQSGQPRERCRKPPPLTSGSPWRLAVRSPEFLPSFGPSVSVRLKGISATPIYFIWNEPQVKTSKLNIRVSLNGLSGWGPPNLSQKRRRRYRKCPRLSAPPARVPGG